ncbi:MAG: tRNA glutamyl-Q(34) synthetase GluQRS [Muribaculaceae bacterium]|nr:tRNA glutamyl-Q(34) synthetase GluQRS [Muribaculaceae bacterium]
MDKTIPSQPVGRFAPSPTGRMHMGNIFTAVMSWLSVKSRGGRWILRIEDLDPQRSRLEYARIIEDDLNWLGLEWDEGGLDNIGSNGPYLQSKRHDLYREYLHRLELTGYTYPCHCTRADIMATQAPHRLDGRVVYAGTCRPANLPLPNPINSEGCSTRLYVPDREIKVDDMICGPSVFNLAEECGDFILRRADGAWSYQLAVVVDDAIMGVTEVMRGNDLLPSAAQQIYLHKLLGFTPPAFAHVPLIVNHEGRRLSKRDKEMAMDSLRLTYSPEEILGIVAYLASFLETPEPLSLNDLLDIYRPLKSTATATRIIDLQP